MLDHGWFRVPHRHARESRWNWRVFREAAVSCPGKLTWGVRFYVHTLMAEVRHETVSTLDTEERWRRFDRQQLAAEKLHRATLRLRFIERDDADG